MSTGAKLWIIIARPDRLPGALVAAEAVGPLFPGGCHLLREHSSWWERAQWERFAERFASVHAFPRVETCRGLRDLPRLYRETSARRRAVAALPVNSERDLFLFLAGTLSLTNAAISAHPSACKILAIAHSMYADLIRPLDRVRFRFTTSGWFQNRVVEPLAGVERTVNLRPRFGRGGDGTRFSRFTRDVSELFDATIILSNRGTALPPCDDEHVAAARFPSISELRADPDVDADSPGEAPRVVFFGTPFLLIHNVHPDVYAQQLSRCLHYLRKHYADRCRLIYRPHPAEKGEASALDLEGFEIENDREVAELYFLRHFKNLAAVYSVSSTVSRVAFNNGLNAYAFWRVFPFSQSATEFFESVMGEVPPEFEIRDLAIPPVGYAAVRSDPRDAASFSQTLTRIVTSRLKLTARAPIQ